MPYIINTPSTADIMGMYEFLEEVYLDFSEFKYLVTENKIEFNNGCCGAFATYYAILIEEAEIVDSNLFMDILQEHIKGYDYGADYHEFLKIGQRYYDLECLSGETQVWRLPFFERMANKYNKKLS